MVGPFMFRCPATGLNVQHIFDDATPGREDDRVYVGVRCLACYPSGKPRDWLFGCGHGGRVAAPDCSPPTSDTILSLSRCLAEAIEVRR
jgi:hypothetical protein